MARMIGMIGVIILIVREIILMTRMIAQICKNTREIKKTEALPSAAPPRGRWLRSRPLGCVFLAMRMINPVIPIILAIRRMPVYNIISPIRG